MEDESEKPKKLLEFVGVFASPITEPCPSVRP